MKKSYLFSQDLLQHHRQDNRSLSLRVRSEAGNESFSVRYAGGNFHLDAASDLGAIYGLSHLKMGLASPYRAEFLGDWHPRFPLRPLWIGSPTKVILSPLLSLHVPEFLTKKSKDLSHLDPFCRRILELGYNSVVFGSWDQTVENSFEGTIDLEAICSYFHQYDLKVILKPNKLSTFCPFDRSHATSIKQEINGLLTQIPSLDYLLWQANPLQHETIQHPLAEESTQLERVQSEVELIEKALQGRTKLIYYLEASDPEIAEQQASWLPVLCDAVGKNTIIAFSAVAGAPWMDHLPPHPFWETLRRSPDISSTPLLPIINSGGVRQGSGLWPTLSLDLSEKFLARCERHHFAGAIGLVSQLPLSGALLECSLWVTGQAMWRQRSAYRLAETWFASQRADFDYPRVADALNQIRQLGIDLSWIRSLRNEHHRDVLSHTECKTAAESLLARLRQLQTLFEMEEKKQLFKPLRPTCGDYFLHFAQDARRLIGYFMQSFQVSLPHIWKEEEDRGGFWTSPKQVMQGSSTLLDIPQKGASGSRMEQIFNETGF